MFVNTSKISNILIFLDTLISINGTRPTSSIFTADIIPSTVVTLDLEVCKALEYITRSFRYAVVTQYSYETLDLIRQKLKPQIEFGACFAEDRGNLSLSDVGRQIKIAVHTLGFKPCETVFLSGDATSITTAIENNLGTVCWVNKNHNLKVIFESGTDFIADTVIDIQNILTWKSRGYYSEVMACPPDFFMGKPDYKRDPLVGLNNEERAGEYIFVGGRYFSTKDTRYQRHALSLRIINSKDHMENQRPLFSSIMANMVLSIANHTKLTPDLITRVPAKPGQHDRLAEQLQAIPAVTNGKISMDRIAPDILTCTRTFPSQKGIGYTSRRDNVRGAFKAHPAVAGKIVYVMDDVLTSGSTLKEACNILYAAGAKFVIPLAMAFHPRTLTSDMPNIKCKKCGVGTIKARCGRNGSIFYGCSNYFPGKCKASSDFKSGVVFINRALRIDTPE